MLLCFGEAGSFDSYQFGISSAGQLDDVQYAVELGSSSTANDTTESFPVQDYEQDFAVLSLRWAAADDLALSLVYRGSNNQLDTTQIFFIWPQHW